MPDTLHRLDRRIPGDRFHRKGDVEKRAGERLEREVQQDPLRGRKHKDLKPHKVRNTWNTAQAEPNAPKLIRLRRHPYQLDLGYFRPHRDIARAKVKKGLRSRPSVAKALQEAKRPERMALPKPSEARHRLEARVRPSVAEWLGDEQ